MEVVDGALATETIYANASGRDLIGVRAVPETHENGVFVKLDCEAPVPDAPTQLHTAFSRRSVRFMNLQSLYRHISSVTHFDAIRLLIESSQQGRAVALYLRSFDLSAGMGRIVDPTVKISETDPDDVATFSSRTDREFQQRLAEAVTGPIVGIANRRAASVFDFQGIPKIIVRDEMWSAVVSGLVANSYPIVVYASSPSIGLLLELELIIREAKAANTIFVEAAENIAGTRAPLLQRIKCQWMQDEMMCRWRAVDAAFTNRVSSNDDAAVLQAAWREALSTRGTRASPPIIPLPDNYGPPTPVADAIAEDAEKLLTDAMRALETGHIPEGEDLAYKGLVRAVFAHHPAHIVWAFLFVGVAAQMVGAFDESSEILQWTITLAEKAGIPEGKAMAVARLDGQRRHLRRE
jgi:hypothetical protein